MKVYRDFAEMDLARILCDIKQCVKERDWARLEAKVEDLRVWARWVQIPQSKDLTKSNENVTIGVWAKEL